MTVKFCSAQASLIQMSIYTDPQALSSPLELAEIMKQYASKSAIGRLKTLRCTRLNHSYVVKGSL